MHDLTTLIIDTLGLEDYDRTEIEESITTHRVAPYHEHEPGSDALEMLERSVWEDVTGADWAW